MVQVIDTAMCNILVESNLRCDCCDALLGLQRRDSAADSERTESAGPVKKKVKLSLKLPSQASGFSQADSRPLDAPAQDPSEAAANRPRHLEPSRAAAHRPGPSNSARAAAPEMVRLAYTGLPDHLTAEYRPPKCVFGGSAGQGT